MKTDLTRYVYQKMIEDAHSYQWRIVYDSHKRALEVYFVISLESDSKHFVQDINGQVNRNNLIQLEEIICIYDEMENRIVPNNYLYAVPFNREEGIEEGLVDALLKQLNIVIAGAASQIRDFLLDANENEFELQWNEVNFKNTIETLKDTGNYARNRLTFEEQDKQSLVEQFKEDTYDGVERI